MAGSHCATLAFVAAATFCVRSAGREPLVSSFQRSVAQSKQYSSLPPLLPGTRSGSQTLFLRSLDLFSTPPGELSRSLEGSCRIVCRPLVETAPFWCGRFGKISYHWQSESQPLPNQTCPPHRPAPCGVGHSPVSKRVCVAREYNMVKVTF